jgi:hypothetical protein
MNTDLIIHHQIFSKIKRKKLPKSRTFRLLPKRSTFWRFSNNFFRLILPKIWWWMVRSANLSDSVCIIWVPQEYLSTPRIFHKMQFKQQFIKMYITIFQPNNQKIKLLTHSHTNMPTYTHLYSSIPIDERFQCP